MAAKPAPAQPSLDDDADQRRNDALVKRLETMGNLVDDLLARLPRWRREIDSMIEEIHRR